VACTINLLQLQMTLLASSVSYGPKYGVTIIVIDNASKGWGKD